MSGILLLIIAALWLVIAFFLVKALGRVLPEIWWAYVLRAVLFLALVPLPLIDELVGKQQFERLCRENAGIEVDRAKATDRTVFLSPQPTWDVEGTWVRVVVQPWRYVDSVSGETVVSYNTLQAVGGRLAISEGRVPLTFKGNCGPSQDNRLSIFRDLRIIKVERPQPGKSK